MEEGEMQEETDKKDVLLAAESPRLIVEIFVDEQHSRRLAAFGSKAKWRRIGKRRWDAGE